MREVSIIRPILTVTFLGFALIFNTSYGQDGRGDARKKGDGARTQTQTGPRPELKTINGKQVWTYEINGQTYVYAPEVAGKNPNLSTSGGYLTLEQFRSATNPPSAESKSASVTPGPTRAKSIEVSTQTKSSNEIFGPPKPPEAQGPDVPGVMKANGTFEFKAPPAPATASATPPTKTGFFDKAKESVRDFLGMNPSQDRPYAKNKEGSVIFQGSDGRFFTVQNNNGIEYRNYLQGSEVEAQRATWDRTLPDSLKQDGLNQLARVKTNEADLATRTNATAGTGGPLGQGQSPTASTSNGTPNSQSQQTQGPNDFDSSAKAQLDQTIKTQIDETKKTYNLSNEQEAQLEKDLRAQAKYDSSKNAKENLDSAQSKIETKGSDDRFSRYTQERQKDNGNFAKDENVLNRSSEYKKALRQEEVRSEALTQAEQKRDDAIFAREKLDEQFEAATSPEEKKLIESQIKSQDERIKDLNGKVTEAETKLSDAKNNTQKVRDEKIPAQGKIDARDDKDQASAERYNKTYEDTDAEGRIDYNKNYSHTSVSKKSDDDCQVSDSIDGEYSCSSSGTLISTQQGFNAITQAAGTLTVNAIGQNEANKALQKGSQSAALEASAKLAKISGYTQGTLGLLNMAAGAGMKINANTHRKNAKTIANETSDGSLLLRKGASSTGIGRGGTSSSDDKIEGSSALNRRIINKFRVEEDIEIKQKSSKNAQEQKERDRAYDKKAQLMQARISNIGDDASSEQRKIAKSSEQGAFTAFTQGAVGLIQSVASLLSAREAEKAAKRLRQSEEGPSDTNFESDPFPNSGADTARQTPPFSPPGEEAPILAIEEEDGKDKLPNAGPGLDPGSADDGVPFAPKDIARVPNNGQVSQGGGGAGGIGPGNTPSEARDESGGEGKASPYSEDLNGRTYLNSGYAAGGGGARGGDDGPGIDLGGMLAQFLPKSEDDAPAIKSLQEYGARGPAAESAMTSLLGQDVNLFERISMAYQEKSRRNQFRMR